MLGPGVHRHHDHSHVRLIVERLPLLLILNEVASLLDLVERAHKHPLNVIDRAHVKPV